MTKISHLETNPHNARRLVQRYGRETIVVNPPNLPLVETEMDQVYALPYTRKPHPVYGRCKDSSMGSRARQRADHARLLRWMHVLLDYRS